MTPYWTSPDGAVVVYCARWEDVVAAGCVPCVAAGLRCIACVVVEDYCRVAVARLGAVTAAAAQPPAGPLFAGRQP